MYLPLHRFYLIDISLNSLADQYSYIYIQNVWQKGIYTYRRVKTGENKRKLCLFNAETQFNDVKIILPIYKYELKVLVKYDSNLEQVKGMVFM